MRLVFVFPGQGSQTPRMGWELYRELPQCRRIFEQAGPVIQRQIFEGRTDALQATENLQPAISVVNAACLAAVHERGYPATAVAGHSLGEFSAAYAAGVLGFDDLVRLTTARGRIMAEAAAGRPGGMLAVDGLPIERISEIVDRASTVGIVCIANRNADDQFVLSGEHAALDRAADDAREAGARTITRLRTSGAWHSPLMSPSRARFEQELQAVTFHDAQTVLYPNVTAEPTRSGEQIRRCLAQQYDSGVLWSQTMRNIIRDHPDAEFVELGPGRVLTGLLLRIDRRRTVHTVNSAASLAAFLRKTSAA